MNIDRVKIDEEGRPYIIQKQTTSGGRPEGKMTRRYGQIVECKCCFKKFFASNTALKLGIGRYCSNKCVMTLENSPMWKGGKIKNVHGYILIKSPSHPNANIKGYVFEHRLIMESKLNRLLTKDEEVHHIDGNRSNNTSDNLMVMSKIEHLHHHISQKNRDANGRLIKNN